MKQRVLLLAASFLLVLSMSAQARNQVKEGDFIVPTGDDSCATFCVAIEKRGLTVLTYVYVDGKVLDATATNLARVRSGNIPSAVFIETPLRASSQGSTSAIPTSSPPIPGQTGGLVIVPVITETPTTYEVTYFYYIYDANGKLTDFWIETKSIPKSVLEK